MRTTKESDQNLWALIRLFISFTQQTLYRRSMTAPVFDLTYNTLPDKLYATVNAEKAAGPDLFWANSSLAETLGVAPDWLRSDAAQDLFTGQTAPSDYAPLAMAYSGHQFGHLSPQLGDGRAVLIGELTDPKGRRHDVHLKGSGKTPFSRRGDGRSTLRAALKEVLFSEFFAALNVPTSRALAAYQTSDIVPRQKSHPGAVLVRTARSLIRVGTFQFAALNTGPDDIRALADFLIARDFPEIEAKSEDRYLELIKAVTARQAELIARWMSLGFIHGVMNTDNMALSGETIDFGPCAMMERFKPDQVFSSIDHYGRYAWHRQADIGLWNLSRFAETLLPILSDAPDDAIPLAEQALEDYPQHFRGHLQNLMATKLGLNAETLPEGFISEFIQMLAEARPDYTLFFRALIQILKTEDDEAVLSLCENPEAMRSWLPQWRDRVRNSESPLELIASTMAQTNPATIPRLHLVEDALDAAEAGNREKFDNLLKALQTSFEAQADQAVFDTLSPAAPQYAQTFCET